MRYLQCNGIEIDTQNQILVRNGEKITLAPKVYDLLLYFCQNGQRVISKDELMEQVWSGTLVTENAISRTLVKVRKALGDDPKAPQFIITVPRKGYRMTQAFEYRELSLFPTKSEYNNIDHVDSGQSFSDSRFITRYKLLLVALVGMIICATVIYQKLLGEPIHLTKQVRPLTRELGKEHYPAMSPDLVYLSYTKEEDLDNSYIIIEHLVDHSQQVIKQPQARLSKLVWSNNQKQVAFLFRQTDKCHLYLANFDTIAERNSWKKLTDCGSNSNPTFTYDPTDSYLIYNDRIANSSGYQIFRINLASLKKDIVNQPITSGKGNYAFDISPDGETLVMLNSEFEPVTTIFTLALAQGELKKTAELDYLMRSVTFHHDSETIVHPSPHPAYELWQSNLAGEKVSVIASNALRVKHPMRVNNGKDFVFVSYLLNRDVGYLGNADLSAQIEHNNSSVMDYLPTLANQSNSYAYVSKRSMDAEVFYVQEDDDGLSKPQQLTSFDQHVQLYHLEFSPDDSQLAILADNQLYIADINKKTTWKLPIDNISIQGLSWQSSSKLMFTTVHNNKWQVMSYDIDEKLLTNIADDYSVDEYFGGIYSPTEQAFFLISAKNSQVIRVEANSNPKVALPLFCQPALIERKVNLQLAELGTLVCFSEKEQQLHTLNLTTKQLSEWHQLPTNVDFDINSQGIIYTELSQSVADILSTTSR